MSFEIEIIENGNTFTLTAYEPSIENIYGEESRLFASVLRQEFQSVLSSIAVSNAEVNFYDFGTLTFGGRFVDYTNSDDRVELEIGTFEEDAIVAEPTSSTLEFTDTDDVDIVRDAISRVPTLSEGTLEIEYSNIDMVFSNASPAKMIRQVQRETGNFVRYQPDGSVDYLCNCGQDKTGTIISPQQSNVSESFDVNEFDREDYNNLRVLGASQGDSQIQAEATISTFDPNTDRAIWKTFSDKEITSESRAQQVANTIIAEYENSPLRIDVQTVVFGEEVNIGDTFTVQSDRDNLDQELTAVEVIQRFEGTQDIFEVVFSNRLLTRLGDAQKQRRDVEKFNTAFQGSVVTLTSGGYRAPVDSGNPYQLTVRKPSDVVEELTAEVEIDALPYRYYSSLGEHSHSLDIDVPDHTHDVTVNLPDHTHDVTVDIPDHTHDVSFTVPEHSHTITLGGHTHNVSVSGNVETNSDHGSVAYDEALASSLTTTTGFTSLTTLNPNTSYEYAIVHVSATNSNDVVFARAGDSNGYFPSADGIPLWQSSSNAGTGTTTIIVPSDIGSVDVEYDSQSSQGDIEVRAMFVGEHDHPISLTVSEESASSTVDNVTGGQVSNTTTSDATVNAQVTETSELNTDAQVTETSGSGGGVFQSQTTSTEAAISAGISQTNDTPSNVSLLVNGTAVASSIGTGEFSEVIDISNQLTEGFNTIEVQSDSLGHVRATVFQDLYRQITQT